MMPYIANYIPSYGLFGTLGLFSMMMLIYIRKRKIAFFEYLILIGSMVLGAALGSKLLFLITQIPDIIAHFSIGYLFYKIITGGFVFYGGMFGAILGCCIFSRIKKYNVAEILNLVAPGYAIFHVFGRIGCFFAGCCYGKPADWGFALWSEPEVLRIPVQLIESGFLLCLVFILLIREKTGKADLFIIYIISYAVFRFFIEFWRGDTIRGIWWGFSTSQIISLLILVVFFIHGIGLKIYQQISLKEA